MKDTVWRPRGMVIAVAVAVLSVVIFHRSSPVYLGFFFDSRSRAESLRAPGPGVSGWIARKLMAIVNQESNVDVVESLLSVHSGHTVVELGPGHGFSLREILRKEPAHTCTPSRSQTPSGPPLRLTRISARRWRC